MFRNFHMTMNLNRNAAEEWLEINPKLNDYPPKGPPVQSVAIRICLKIGVPINRGSPSGSL